MHQGGVMGKPEMETLAERSRRRKAEIERILAYEPAERMDALLRFWVASGCDFREVVEMMDCLPPRPLKSWHGIVADGKKLDAFFRSLEPCAWWRRLRSETFPWIAADSPLATQLEPEAIREECKKIVDQADALLGLLNDMSRKLTFCFEIEGAAMLCVPELASVRDFYDALRYAGKLDAAPAWLKREWGKHGSKKFVSMQPRLNPYRQLARTLTLLAGYKEHARAMLLVVEGHFESGMTAATLKGMSKDALSEWFGQKRNFFNAL